MTTPTRPLPQGVEIRDLRCGHDQCFHWAGKDGFPTEAEAIAAYWAHHDRPPENQAKAEPKYDSPGYRAGYAAGLESAERVIASLTARVAALEAKATPTITDVEQYHEEIDGKPSPGPRLIEGMNQLRYAVQNGTLDQLPTTVVARCGTHTVRYTREPSPPPAPPEPVVGMAYMWKRHPTHEHLRICSDGVVEYCATQWRRSGFSHHDIAKSVASGDLVPVPGYRVEGKP